MSPTVTTAELSPNAADFSDMLPSTVMIAPFLSSDNYGKPTYGEPKPYFCHVSSKTGFIRGSSGELVATKGAIWVQAASDNFTAQDQIILPNGGSPLILAINGAQDETGLDLYTRFDFG